MKQQLLILATLLALFVLGEGRTVPEAVSVKERLIENWSIKVTWEACLGLRLKFEILNYDVDVNIAIKITPKQQNASPEVEKNMTLSNNDTIQVSSNQVGYDIEWTDLDDTNHSGTTSVDKCGEVEGDPHMRTFSGAKFNFQGHCSYTLVKDCRRNPPSFDIAGAFRGRYNPWEAPTRMVAVTTRVQGGDEYTFQEDNSVLVNDFPVLDRDLTVGNNAGHIQVRDSGIIMYLNEDDVTLEWTGKKHDVSVSVGNKELVGKLCGMLGDGTNVKGHDLVKSDGTKTFNTTEFAESWVIPGSCV